jgi:hypothetical protein
MNEAASRPPQQDADSGFPRARFHLGNACDRVPRARNTFKVMDLLAHPAAAMLGMGKNGKNGKNGG